MIVNYKNVEIKHDDVTILTGVDFEVSQGDFIFITGRVGSGKSTLLSTVYGELRPTGGEARVLDYDMRKIKWRHIPHLRSQLGIVFQSFELLTNLTVRSNLRLVLKATGMKGRDNINRRIEEVLAKTDLLDKADKFPFELSGGEQQRVAIARSLLNKPKLIIADEPTGNLDAETGLSVMKLLEEIRSEGTAIIMTTHNMSLINIVEGARIYRCQDGHLVYQNNVDVVAEVDENEDNGLD